jgi:hypothetical protein
MENDVKQTLKEFGLVQTEENKEQTSDEKQKDKLLDKEVCLLPLDILKSANQ